MVNIGATMLALIPEIRILRDPGGVILLSETTGRYLILDGADKDYISSERTIRANSPGELISVLKELGFLSAAGTSANRA